MEAVCPDAWMLNITNPMTTLCRAVTRETEIKTVGLCHEVTMAQFTLSQLLDADFRDFDLTVTGVNHLPIVTDITIAGDDGFARLRELLADTERKGDEPVHMPPGLGHEQHSFGGSFRKRDVLAANRVKFALFERFGVLPAAGDRHLVEFFPGFLTEESEWGKRWGVGLTSIADREAWQDYYKGEFAELKAAPDVPNLPSGEIVAPLIDAFLRDKTRHFPLNLPNTGQCPDLPTRPGRRSDGHRRRPRPHTGATPRRRRPCSRSGCAASSRARKRRSKPRSAAIATRSSRRCSSIRSRAASTSTTSRQMTDELLAATKPWLPQFA